MSTVILLYAIQIVIYDTPVAFLLVAFHELPVPFGIPHPTSNRRKALVILYQVEAILDSERSIGQVNFHLWLLILDVRDKVVIFLFVDTWNGSEVRHKVEESDLVGNEVQFLHLLHLFADK